MKNITIKEIAERAQVSRGTVDRVLNHRGDVREETRQKVLKILEEVKYTPNVAARALKSQDKNLVIGILVSPASNAYGQRVRRGVEYAKEECTRYGVGLQIYEMKEFSIPAQLEQLQRVEADSPSALALAPMEDDAIQKYLEKLADKMPLAFYNTRLEHIDHLCYIGQDSEACGRVAGQLLGMLSQGQGATMMLLGYRMIKAHLGRLKGFRQYLEDFLPGMNLVAEYETRENVERTKELCKKAFEEYPIRNIFISGGGIDGLGEFLLEEGLIGKVNVVCTDYICRTVEFLKKNIIQFAIGQQPFEQGYYPIKILMDYLLAGTRPQSPAIYTNLDIRVKENIDCNFFPLHRAENVLE